ncbi:uncharacterized protein LOC111924207 [Cyanistes caeruleus]|uniref:uncharacterized protein LOC111924207 n=1 Tax=Cyanistes caeruleus TaxID=156563 RepID=UPI000CDA21E6|nr:uncharacterized protein LOC111924207 [Cyanistes caeruleus]
MPSSALNDTPGLFFAHVDARVPGFPAGADTARPFPVCAGGPSAHERNRAGAGRSFTPVGLATNRAPGCGPALPPGLPVPSWPRRLWGAKTCLHTPGTSAVSAQPAHLNVLLVPSWHSLLPDRFLQSKHFGCKAAQQPELQSYCTDRCIQEEPKSLEEWLKLWSSKSSFCLLAAVSGLAEEQGTSTKGAAPKITGSCYSRLVTPCA